MLAVQNFLLRYRLPLLSGVFVGTSYIPLPPWALIFCLAPLWIFVIQKAQTWREAFFAGWLAQFVFTLIGFYWTAYAAHDFGYLPWSVSMVILIIFAAGVHLYFPLVAAAGFYLRQRFSLRISATLLLMTVLIALAEQYWPSLFPWNLGYPWLFAKIPLYQWADTIGFLGLSWMTHLLSALCAFLWIRKSWKYSLVAIAAIFLVLGGLTFTGIGKEKSWMATDSELRVLQIQANIGNAEKIFAENGFAYEQVIFDKYVRQTRAALEKFKATDLVVWPETAFPESLEDFDKKEPLTAQFFRFLAEIKTPLLTGADAKDAPGPSAKEYNGLFLFGEDGKAVASAYHKTYLLAFGESTPLANIFPWLGSLSPAGDFGVGTGPEVMPFKGNIFGVQICYEGLYPEFTRMLSEKGAVVLMNITNDSWFGPTHEPWQHLYMTFGRAIETRRPLVRTTNTGISGVILASGQILSLSPQGQAWSQLQLVRYLKNPPTTFYTRFGDWWPVFLFFVLGLTLVFGRRPRV